MARSLDLGGTDAHAHATRVADRATRKMAMRIGDTKFDRGTISKNIEAILKLEADDKLQLSPLHRISHHVGWFVGTIYFVMTQAAFVLGWLLWNSWGTPSFDPYPFALLSGILGLEVVFLTSFVLIRQNAMDLQSDRRNHLDLQINLLAEKEATSILRALGEIAKHFQIELTVDEDSRELAQDTAVEGIARDLRSREKEDEAKH